MVERRAYELTAWSAPGPAEPIPLLLYHRADLPGPKPVAVYYHGVVQRKESYVDSHPLARALADHGIVVALPDAPGHGERPAAARLVERLKASLPREFCADIEASALEAPALLDWLGSLDLVDASRMAVAGYSMGGFTAAVVAGRERTRLRTAVAMAGSGDLPGCFAATDSIGPEGWGPCDRSLDAETEARIARIDPLLHPELLDGFPLLIVHGESDTWNPCRTSRAVARRVGSARLEIVPGAVHWPPGPAVTKAALDWLVDRV
ncbi:MAG: alpha/beta fold hydrolase [Candidatus Dormibacteraeota bacterium]|nr:alpha/beta fold hydrolase [Candidatus Dormibacteraeota bacterium]